MVTPSSRRIIVLLHSPLVGPSTWHAVAERLVSAGTEVAVPDLMPASRSERPVHPKISDIVASSVDATAGEGPVVLVGHSMAGLLVPGIMQALQRPVAAVIFVDSALPQPGATWFDTAPADLAEHLHGLAVDGWLPPWHRWFPDDTLASLLTDPVQRERFVAEVPQLPLSLFEEPFLGEATWAQGIPCGFVLLSEPYRDEARRAVERGWEVTELDLHHLAPMTDPGAVSTALRTLLARLQSAG